MLLLVPVKAKNPNFKMNFLKRGSIWNVFFRLKGRQFSLSTGEVDLEAAQIQGARIFLAQVEKGHCGGEVRNVQDVIDLFWKWHATPNQGKKPSTATGHKYEVCLRKVSTSLKITDLGKLALKAAGLTAKDLGVSESNYVSLVRQSAALFNKRFLAWAKSVGKELVNPFASSIPPTPAQKQFKAPSLAQVLALTEKVYAGVASDKFAAVI